MFHLVWLVETKPPGLLGFLRCSARLKQPGRPDAKRSFPGWEFKVLLKMCTNIAQILAALLFSMLLLSLSSVKTCQI